MKGKRRKILFAVCVIVAGIAIGYLILYYTRLAKNEKKYEEVKKEVVKEEVKEEQQQGDTYTSPIDFAKLQEQNPDVYAWIEIPGTNVNYPILQHPTDDVYYLDHTIDGTAGLPGSIYTESCNYKDFSDFNTVIYGHDMRDGTMFKDLHKYEDAEFLKEHPEVIIYTPEKKFVYRIFAAVVYSDMHIMEGYNFLLESERQAFLDSIYESRDMRNSIDESVEVTPENRIITLSTCIGNEADHRFLVGAVLVDE